MDMLKNPFIGGGFGGLLVIMMVFADHKYHRSQRKNKEYFRMFIMASLIVGGIIHFSCNSHPSVQSGGGPQSAILIGRPDF